MNSLDPWRVIATDPYGSVVLPPPYYGHPFYRQVPGWIDYFGGTAGVTRQLFDGAFIGCDLDTPTGDNMTNNIGAELTALSVPGYGGYPFAPFYRSYGSGLGYPFAAPFRPYGGVFFGADQAPAPAQGFQRTGLTKDLAPFLAPATGGIMVRKHLDDKQVLHVEICVDGKCHSSSMDLAPAVNMLMGKLKDWHDRMHAQQPPPSTVVSTVQKAVAAAEDAIVGALVTRHIDTVAAGLLGDIAGAVRGAVTGVARGVRSTFSKLKGPIGAAAGIAAAAGAAAIPGVGVVAAPLAAKLASDLVQSAAGDSKAQQAVAQAARQAQTDPTVAAALDQATKAVANSTAAYHVQDTAKKAAQGDSAAQQEIVKVADDVQKGDPAAKAVADLIANAMKSEWGAKLWEQLTGRGPATVSTIPSLPTGTTAAGWYDVIGADIASPTLIAVLDEDGNATARQVMWHPTHDQIQRFGGKTPEFYTEDEGGLFLFADSTGRYSTYRPTWTVMYWSEGGAVPSPVSGWQDVVDAAVDSVRAKAKAHAVTKPGSAAGVLVTVDGRLHGRGFRNLDDAIDWLQHITRNRAAFMYAAAYEKDASGNAYTQDEEFGELPQQAPAPTPIPRDLATTGRW